MFTYISEAFSHGGIWMYAILGVHILSIAIVIERVYVLYYKKSIGQMKLARLIEDDIKRGRLDSAISKAKALPQSESIAVVAQAGLTAAINMGGKEEIQAKMEEILDIEKTRLEKRTPFLGMIGNVATLLGLLGTITGMIKSFGAVGMANATEKAGMLSLGISEAMNCTAYGLIVAIPALIMYAVLQNRTNQIQEDLTQGATKILNWLSFNYEPVPRTKKQA